MSSDITHIGGIVWPIFWCNVICWILVYLCICNGVKSVGKVSFISGHFYWKNAKATLFLDLDCFGLLEILFMFTDRVLHGFVSICRTMRLIYSWNNVTGCLARHTILYSSGLESIDETKGILHHQSFV